jgi:hypothetical protein
LTLSEIGGYVDLRKQREIRLCEYCGNPASTVDREPISTLRVPVCVECRGLLRNQPLWTVAERRDYVRERLRERYEPLLRIPDWRGEELGELEGRLLQYVQNSITAADVLNSRLNWKVVAQD